jgi:hypothetical protein
MSAVSMGSPQSWNRYAYVANSPLTATDPFGLWNEERYYLGGNFDNGFSDPGAAWLSSEIQQFMEDAGLNSPIQQALTQHLGSIPGYAVHGGDLWFNAGGFVPGYFSPGVDPEPEEIGTFLDRWVDLGSIGGDAANNDSWLWTATKSFFRDFSVFGPKNDPRPSCFGNFAKESIANFAGVPGIDTTAAGAAGYYGISLSMAQAVPSSRALRGGLSAKQWLRADEATRLTNAGKFSLALNAVVAEGQAIANEIPSALAGECK